MRSRFDYRRTRTWAPQSLIHIHSLLWVIAVGAGNLTTHHRLCRNRRKTGARPPFSYRTRLGALSTKLPMLSVNTIRLHRHHILRTFFCEDTRRIFQFMDCLYVTEDWGLTPVRSRFSAHAQAGFGIFLHSQPLTTEESFCEGNWSVRKVNYPWVLAFYGMWCHAIWYADITTFRTSVFPLSTRVSIPRLALKPGRMTTHSTDTLVTVYQTTWYHITDHITNHRHQRQNLRTLTLLCIQWRC